MVISDELEKRVCRLQSRLGLSYQEVLERVIAAGLEDVEKEALEKEKKKKKKKQHNPEWLKWLKAQLLEEGKTYQKVGNELGVSRETVRQYCLEYGIDIKKRTARWYAKRWGVPELETPDWLLNQPRSNLAALAGKLGISLPTLENQIKRLGLDPKDFSRQAEKVTWPCSNCGRPVTRPAYCVEKRGYQQFFCDRRCLGKWLGKNFGVNNLLKACEKKKRRPEEEEFIRANWQKMSDQEIAKQLGRRPSTISRWRRQLGLLRAAKGMKKRRPEEEEFIRANWQKMSDQELAKQLGRSPITISRWRRQLGLLRAAKGKRWADNEIWFLRKYYPQREAAWIGEILGRSPGAVRMKAFHLGLRRAKKTEAPP